MTLEEAISIYLKITRSKFTNDSYRRALLPMKKVLGADRPLKTLTYTDLLTYTSEMNADNHLEPSSYRLYVQVIKTFFKWCADSDHMDRNPTRNIKLPKARKSSKNRAIPPGDLRKMVEYSRRSARNYALMLFLIDTGCRVGGASSLRLSQLDLDEGMAVLEEKANPQMVVYFGERTAEALRQWLAVRPQSKHEYVFTRTKKSDRRLGRRGISIVVGRISERSCGVRYTGHQIRHAVASAWAYAGMLATETQCKLGHSSATITLDNYYPKAEDAVKQLSRKFALLALEDTNKGEPSIKARTGRLIRRILDEGSNGG